MPADQVAKFTSIPADVYISYERGDAEPTDKDVKKLARFYRTQPMTFFRSRPPTASRRIDFQRNLSTYRGEPGPVLDAVNTASQFQKLLRSVVPAAETWRAKSAEKISETDNVELAADIWRKKLNISDKSQLEIKSKSLFFTLVRSRIEALGIGVMVESFPERFIKGLVVGADTEIPVILINSFRQQKSSRTFTLVHEFAHVLLGRDDVSNPYEPDNNLERFCNKFAASLLMPKEMVARLLAQRSTDVRSNAGIKWLANKLKISMEAVVIRLQDCGFVPTDFWSNWKKQFGGQTPWPSEEPEGGGGGDEPVDQGLVKLARLGFLLAASITSGQERQGIPNMAVYKASRLKPEYISSLVEAAKSRLAEFDSYAAE